MCHTSFNILVQFISFIWNIHFLIVSYLPWSNVTSFMSPSQIPPETLNLKLSLPSESPQNIRHLSLSCFLTFYGYPVYVIVAPPFYKSPEGNYLPQNLDSSLKIPRLLVSLNPHSSYTERFPVNICWINLLLINLFIEEVKIWVKITIE